MSKNEQEYVDCDTRDSGCNGGLNVRRFRVSRETRHLHRVTYLYRETGATCLSSCCTVGLSCWHDGVKGVATDGEQALMPALSHQLVSSAIEADQSYLHRVPSCPTVLERQLPFLCA